MEFGEIKWGPAPLGTAGGAVTWNFTGFSSERNALEAPITGRLPRKRVQEVFDAWEAALDIDFRRVGRLKEADIQIGYAEFDGPGGILGLASVVPDGIRITSAVVRMDIEENWTFKGGFAPMDISDPPSFYAVMAHEIGHAIGLAHDPRDRAILHAFADETIELTLPDLRAGVALYGPREGEGRPGGHLLAGDADGNLLKGGAGDDALHGFGGDDRLYGGGQDDRLVGGPGADRLGGGRGDDALIGGAGRDRLDGRAGRDALEGGGGADVFVLRVGGGRDAVSDFDAGRDVVDVPADAQVFVRTQGDDLVVGLGEGDSLRLLGAALAGAAEADLVFV